jgi:glycosyltransferase involved in cell wall biosynthesis
MAQINVLITSPSLNPEKNVSGISSLTNLLIENNNYVNYNVFVSGKEDKDERNIKWILKQILLPFRFMQALLNFKPDIIHINVPLSTLAIYREFTSMLISQLFKKKTVVHIRGGELFSFYNKKKIINIFIMYLLKKADKIIVLGLIEKVRIVQRYQISENKILIIPNAVEVSTNSSDDKDYHGPIEILFLGRIDINKGFVEIENSLLRLVAKEVDFKFTLCGEGPYKETFLKKMGTVIFYKGIVGGKEKAEILAKAHILLLPSYFEGLPNSLLEAMGNYCVPIVTPVGSIPEVVTDNLNGFLVPVNNVDLIVERIEHLNKNRDALKLMSESAFDHINNNYHIKNYCTSLNKLYSSILNINLIS